MIERSQRLKEIAHEAPFEPNSFTDPKYCNYTNNSNFKICPQIGCKKRSPPTENQIKVGL